MTIDSNFSNRKTKRIGEVVGFVLPRSRHSLAIDLKMIKYILYISYLFSVL